MLFRSRSSRDEDEDQEEGSHAVHSFYVRISQITAMVCLLAGKKRARGAGRYRRKVHDQPAISYSHRSQHELRCASCWSLGKKDCPLLMSLELTSQQALQLAAAFRCIAERMRAAHGASEIRMRSCETASRIAFLCTYLIAEQKEPFPSLGNAFQRAIFAAR